MELSTPNKPTTSCCIIDFNNGLDDGYGLNNDLKYNSDRKLPRQVTLMDFQHEEHELVEEIGLDDADAMVPENIIILIDDEIKKAKVICITQEVRYIYLSYAGNKAELGDIRSSLISH